MTEPELSADYLVIGSGAMGMAFTDVLMTESEATVVMVDQHHRPGGHWNDAYPFVRLHQPSAFYGVNSRKLGNDTIDQTGWNKGLYELASAGEVCAYFDQVMQQQFLPTGRVKYFPMSRAEEDGSFRSVLSGERTSVSATKIVDATYMNVQVPAIRGPLYELDPETRCVPLNQLPTEPTPTDGYVVIGAGKTGMDACLFLLANGLSPDRITWIMPRDSWMLDRARIQPGEAFLASAVGGAAGQMESFANAETVDEIFSDMEAQGQLLRLDPAVRPSMYRCATVTQAELEQLRRIERVVRLGRVKRVGANEIQLEQGTIPTSLGTLHVDCSADGLAERPVQPVFAADRITLQSVRTCQQVFSAAFTAHVELVGKDEAHKNHLCTPVPHPNSALDFLRTTLQNATNGFNWGQDAALQEWLQEARLDGFSGPVTNRSLSTEMEQAGEKLAANALPAMQKLQGFLAE
jgi:hypothetical protein